MSTSGSRWEPIAGVARRRGGNGIVTKVRDRDGEFAEPLAMKVLQEGRSYERFKREGRNQDHPALVRVLTSEFPADARDAYVIMPWYEKTAREYVSGHRFKGSPIEAIRFSLPVIEGLEHLHNRSIAHRDIKPVNILLSEKGEPVVADFGLSRNDEDPDLTGTPENLGSFRYRPPEYNDHKAVTDFRPGDIFALGKTIWALIAGREPEQGDVLRYPSYALKGLLGIGGPQVESIQYLLNRMTMTQPEQRLGVGEVLAEFRGLLSPASTTEGERLGGLRALQRRVEASSALHERRRAKAGSSAIETQVKDFVSRLSRAFGEKIAPLRSVVGDAGEITWASQQNLLSGDPSFRVLVDNVPELEAMAPRELFGGFACFIPSSDLPELERVILAFGVRFDAEASAFATVAARHHGPFPNHARGEWTLAKSPVFVPRLTSMSPTNCDSLAERQVGSFAELISSQTEKVPD